MIRDCLVVGIRDRSLSERLQMEPDLSLEKAKKLIRQREAVKEQEARLKTTGTPSGLEEVKSRPQRGNRRFPGPRRPPKPANRQLPTPSPAGKLCRRCGKGSHPLQQCPAKDAECFRCHRKGHYGSQCLSKTIAQVIDSTNQEDGPESEDCYLDTTYLNNSGEAGPAWKIDAAVNGQPVDFKVDTGAEVTAISGATWESMPDTPALQKATKSLCGPDRKPLKLHGQATVELQWKQAK